MTFVKIYLFSSLNLVLKEKMEKKIMKDWVVNWNVFNEKDLCVKDLCVKEVFDWNVVSDLS